MDDHEFHECMRLQYAKQQNREFKERYRVATRLNSPQYRRLWRYCQHKGLSIYSGLAQLLLSHPDLQ